MQAFNNSNKLGDYPFRWEGLEDFNYPFDENGLPLVDMGKTIGLQYNPITISQYGLFNLQKYNQAKEAVFLKKAFVCVDWLFSNIRDWRKDIGAWVYDYSLDFYGPEAPWISAMAQGQAISLLLRAHQMNPDARTQATTDRAFRAFLHPVKDGGIASMFRDGSIIFEEYPTNPPSHVLNGFIFALVGIYDYACFWQNEKALELFKTAASGLTKNLDRYDCGYWNYYDLHPTKRLASPMYIKVHAQLLHILAEITGNNYFSEVAEKWRKYLINPVSRVKWFAIKFKEKLTEN